MPLLTAIDECDCALKSIAIHAELGLAGNKLAQKEASLLMILALCRQTNAIVSDVLTYAQEGY